MVLVSIFVDMTIVVVLISGGCDGFGIFFVGFQFYEPCAILSHQSCSIVGWVFGGSS